jgi:hypothetical protein
MSTNTTYSMSGFVSLDDLRPKAATKLAMSDVIAMRIRIRCRARMRRLAQANAAKAKARAVEEMGR